MPADDGYASTRLGIDFGTSSTVAVVAVPGRESRPLLVDSTPLLPSAVCLDPDGRILTGRDALQAAAARPAAFEPHPKRRIDEGTLLLAGAEVEVTKLFAAVFDRVLAEAAHLTDGPIGTVITCPAGWGSARRAILLSAAPAGTRLVDEPVAAAHYFTEIAGNDVPDGGTAVVYDFGAGTFDAAVVRRTGDGFTTLAARGLPDCGGLDIDATIVTHFAAVGFEPAIWSRLETPTTVAERRARQQLWDNVRAAKETLSRATTTLIHLPLLDAEAPLGREQLDRLAGPILDRTVTAVREVLGEAGVAPADLSAIFLAGGSSRMPAVAGKLHRAFGIAPTRVDQPELAVAEGSLRAATIRHRDTAAPQPTRADTGPPASVRPQPAPPPAPARTRPSRRRLVWAAAAVAGAVGLAVTLAQLATSRGEGSLAAPSASPSAAVSPSVTASPSPSYPPGIDPCLLGTWRVTANEVWGLIDDVRVLYNGGAGVLITYRADGTTATDYNKMQPRTVRYGGATWSDVNRGTTSGRYYAENGTITSTTAKSNVTFTLRRNGKVNASGKANFFPEPAQYRCTGNTLMLYSAQGNYSNDLTRTSPS
ncbi:Hsp70 family protein [Actinomycetes bacterium KLBMP 9797]